MKIQQWLFELLRKQSVTDGRMDGRTDAREITLIELAPSPYFFVSSICLAYMNMFARFDENPAMTLRVIKEKALY